MPAMHASTRTSGAQHNATACPRNRVQYRASCARRASPSSALLAPPPANTLRPQFVASVAVADGVRRHYLISMGRILRNCLLVMAVLGLVVAGPVEAYCASPAAAMASPCAEMPMDQVPAEQQPQDAPAKACTILQCPSTLPATMDVANAIDAPAFHAARMAILPSRVMANAESAPEQRPPIS